MVFVNIEFFTFESEVWFRNCKGDVAMLKESDCDVINDLVEYIATFYPKAYTALCSEYKSCMLNHSYYRFRMVCRFLRCNFAALDTIPDINTDGNFTFEHINCPLRGECKYDHVICRPEFEHKLSTAELRVMALVYDGMTEDSIAESLHLSPRTIHTHVRNAYARLNIHSKGEFVKFASQHNLFS